MPSNLEQMKFSGFDPDQDLQWKKMGDIPVPSGWPEGRNYPQSNNCMPIAIDKHLILVIEQSYSDTENFVRAFDTRTQQWCEEWPSLNQLRYGFGRVLCNGKVYVIGGINHEGEFLDSIECFDLSASPRQWITLDQRLATARSDCKCVAIGTQIFILGGEDDEEWLVSVEIFNTETSQLSHGPDLPRYNPIAAAAVNNELLVFARPKFEGDIIEIHTLETGKPSPTWTTSSTTLPTDSFLANPIVVGDCVVLTPTSVVDTNRNYHLWNLPSTPFSTNTTQDWTLVGKSEIIALANHHSIYSLKLKFDVQPPTATVLQNTKTMFGSMLFSPKYSDMTFVCVDGTEIHAHRNILGASSPYFDTYFSGKWAEEHPDGRWETEKSSEVIKAVLSLIYTGEASSELSDAHHLELLETAYEFELNNDLLRICQAMCMKNITNGNVKDFLLSAKIRNASFLFDACFEYACNHFSQLGSNREFVMDVMNADGGELWCDMFEHQQRSEVRF